MDKFMVITSRISSKIALKCSRANIPMIASKGAVTSLSKCGNSTVKHRAKLLVSVNIIEEHGRAFIFIDDSFLYSLSYYFNRTLRKGSKLDLKIWSRVIKWKIK